MTKTSVWLCCLAMVAAAGYVVQLPAAEPVNVPAKAAGVAAKSDLTLARIDEVNAAIEIFHAKLNRYPSAEKGLLELLEPPGLDAKEDAVWKTFGPVLRKPPTDAWNRPLLYELIDAEGGMTYRVFSIGPDGMEGTVDDLPKKTGAGDGAQQADGNETGVVIRAGGGDTRMGPAPGSRPAGSVRFFGTHSVADVHQMVFVIDRGRTMEPGENHGNLLRAVKYQIRITVRQLKEKQAFHIVYFSGPDDEPLEMASRALVLSTVKNKEKAMDFIDDIPAQERTDPIPALKRAVAVLKDPAAETTTQPTTAAASKNKQIFLLTDGDFPDNDAVLKFVKENTGGVHINTYLIGANFTPTARDTMKKIAEATGGTFKAIEID